MIRRGTLLALMLMVSTSALQAQSAPAFEVASVKPNKSGTRGSALPPPGHGRLSATNVPLTELILEAYQIQEYQLAGATGWMRSERFDISAKSAGMATRAELRQMLQTLLAERFALKLHRETKELPIYAITVAKSGPKIQPQDAGICDALPAEQPCGGFRVSMRRHVVGYKVTLQELGDVLSMLVGRSVLDRSGLSGRYDLKLDWTPDESQFRGLERPDAPLADADGPSLFTAMQEQLGLKLEAQKGPVTVLVIDGAQRPSEN